MSALPAASDNEQRIVETVRAAFEDYERALLHNDVTAMDESFLQDEQIVRFGIAEIQYGFQAIAAWRRSAEPVPSSRRHERVTINVVSPTVAVVALEFVNGGAESPDGKSLPRGRQSQVWQLTDAGWRIAHAHVSMIN